MQRAEHRVAVVVDPTFGERVIDLARECHVWLIRSARNDEVVAALRKDASKHSLEEGITTFNGAESPESSFVSILDAVELHHGEYSHDPPLSVIHAVGLEPSPAVMDALHEYGFAHVESSPEGFVAHRQPG